MRKAFWMLLALVCLLCGVAEASVSLDAVAGAQEYAHYSIQSSAEYPQTETTPERLALIVRDGEAAALLVLDRAQGEAEYALAIAAKFALHQDGRDATLAQGLPPGEIEYSYEYPAGSGLVAEAYHMAEGPQGWALAYARLRHDADDARYETIVTPEENALCYQRAEIDADGQVIRREARQYAYGWRSDEYALQVFSVQALPKDFAWAQTGGMPPDAGVELARREVALPNALLTLTFWEWEAWGTEESAYITHATVDWGGVPLDEIPIGIHIPRELLQLEPEYTINVEDMNFDEFDDFRVLFASQGGNAYYRFWLWDAAQSRFVVSQAMESLGPHPQFSARNQTVTCLTLHPDGSSSQVEYSLQGDVPVAQRRVDTGMTDGTPWEAEYAWEGDAWEVVGTRFE